MRTFDFSRLKCDKRYVIAYIIACIVAIICGIVLCITVQINPYMLNYASEYVYFVFNFRNASLLFPRLFYELVYMYAFFLIAYCTRMRLLCLPLLFLKCMISSVYAGLIISVSAFGGVLAAVFVFIPSSLCTVALEIILIETCSHFNKRYAPFVPAGFALVSMLAECIFLNVLFRVVVAIA